MLYILPSPERNISHHAVVFLGYLSVPPYSKHPALTSLIEFLRARILQMVPSLSRHIQCKHLIFKSFTWPLGHVQIDRSLCHRSFNIEMHMQMFDPSSIFLQSTCDGPVPCPSAPTWLAVRFDLSFAVYAFPGQQLATLGIRSYTISCPVESCCLAVR